MTTQTGAHERRKEAQLRLLLTEDVQTRGITTGLERYRLVHRALPEVDWGEVDISTSLLGKPLRAPVVISAMTGGCRLGATINRNLATAAQQLGLAMGVGSQRAAIVDPELAYTYKVREYAPDILLMGNLGAVQLNDGLDLGDCRRAVEMIGADALCLHLNGVQEVMQRGGDRNFRGVGDKIARVCDQLGAPVVVKEVGWGISGPVAARLVGAGVSAVDVAGAGGTSWYLAERMAAGVPSHEAHRSPFAAWGIPTVESLLETLAVAGSVPVIASGGIRNGVDAAKALTLGASAVGIAQPLLRPAAGSATAVVDWLEGFLFELRLAMFSVGAANLRALRDRSHIVKIE